MNDAAASFHMKSCAQLGAKTPTFTRYVPFFAFIGTVHAVPMFWLTPAVNQ